MGELVTSRKVCNEYHHSKIEPTLPIIATGPIFSDKDTTSNNEDNFS